jgi:hypothetical protein
MMNTTCTRQLLIGYDRFSTKSAAVSYHHQILSFQPSTYLAAETPATIERAMLASAPTVLVGSTINKQRTCQRLTVTVTASNTATGVHLQQCAL